MSWRSVAIQWNRVDYSWFVCWTSLNSEQLIVEQPILIFESNKTRNRRETNWINSRKVMSRSWVVHEPLPRAPTKSSKQVNNRSYRWLIFSSNCVCGIFLWFYESFWFEPKRVDLIVTQQTLESRESNRFSHSYTVPGYNRCNCREMQLN